MRIELTTYVSFMLANNVFLALRSCFNNVVVLDAADSSMNETTDFLEANTILIGTV